MKPRQTDLKPNKAYTRTYFAHTREGLSTAMREKYPYIVIKKGSLQKDILLARIYTPFYLGCLLFLGTLVIVSELTSSYVLLYSFALLIISAYLFILKRKKYKLRKISRFSIPLDSPSFEKLTVPHNSLLSPNMPLISARSPNPKIFIEESNYFLALRTINLKRKDSNSSNIVRSTDEVVDRRIADRRLDDRSSPATLDSIASSEQDKMFENIIGKEMDEYHFRKDEVPLIIFHLNNQTSTSSRIELGTMIQSWMEQQPDVSRIWGLDNLLEGKNPQISPLPLGVKFSIDEDGVIPLKNTGLLIIKSDADTQILKEGFCDLVENSGVAKVKDYQNYVGMLIVD
ncbi:MAG: hypothetical protein AB4050_07715 [Synechococcus sp.]